MITQKTKSFKKARTPGKNPQRFHIIFLQPRLPDPSLVIESSHNNPGVCPLHDLNCLLTVDFLFFFSPPHPSCPLRPLPCGSRADRHPAGRPAELGTAFCAVLPKCARLVGHDFQRHGRGENLGLQIEQASVTSIRHREPGPPQGPLCPSGT